MQKLTKATFLDMDLKEIESTFLPVGRKITDLSLSTNLKIINIDMIIKKPTLIEEIVQIMRRLKFVKFHLDR